MPNMIFHHPYIVFPGGSSGSQVRPYKMIKAFEAIGYEVETVVGYGAQRRKAINRIKRAVKQGKQYDFIYSESSTMPTLLTEVHHYPTYPFLDFGFFKWAKRNSIPIGLFYRDIHWRFSHYTNNVPWFKRAVSIPLYRCDWLQYKRLLDHLFVPSLKMQEVLPGPWDSKKISELPPGCQLNMDIKNQSRTVKNAIQLFYVGGVIPPAYNLKPLFQVVNGFKGIYLTLCCREQEWNYASKLYAPINSQNVEIIHLSGSDLKYHYENSDIFALLWSTYEYLDFAMPVKVFECMGNGLPIIALDGTEAARFIKQENIGWVVKSVNEASNLLEYLGDHREDIEVMKQRVCEVRLRHTWEERARQVVQMLTNNYVCEDK